MTSRGKLEERPILIPERYSYKGNLIWFYFGGSFSWNVQHAQFRIQSHVM